MPKVYFKSFGRRDNDGRLETSIIDPETKVLSTCQTLQEVIRKRVLFPNTRHHGLANRLCVSHPNQEFPGAYRPEGILFITPNRPSFCAPFDIMMLTKGETFTYQDYGSSFIPGHEQFLFDDLESMQAEFPSSGIALEKLNYFRAEHGLNPIEGRAYNEVCFEGQTPIKLIALVGASQEVRRLGEENRIRTYSSISNYLGAVQRKREIRELVGTGISAIAAASLLLTAQFLFPQSLERAGQEYLDLGNAYFQK